MVLKNSQIVETLHYFRLKIVLNMIVIWQTLCTQKASHRLHTLFLNIFLMCSVRLHGFFSNMNQNWEQEWLTPFPSWMRQDLNPRPLDHESSLLTTRPDRRQVAYSQILMKSTLWWKESWRQIFWTPRRCLRKDKYGEPSLIMLFLFSILTIRINHFKPGVGNSFWLAGHIENKIGKCGPV